MNTLYLKNNYKRHDSVCDVEVKKLDIKYMVTLLEDTTIKTKDLLSEKGFINNITDGALEKVVLLNTEIAELTDAVKKGFGDKEEGMELADIIIRACNFCCADEVFNKDIQDFKTITSSAYDSYCFRRGASVVEDKFILINAMIECFYGICNFVEAFATKNSVYGASRYSSIYRKEIRAKILQLVAICSIYSDEMLGSNLHCFVEEKMSKNFKRPYRFNSDGLHE